VSKAVDGLFERLSDKANSEQWLFGLVQKLHLPFSVLFEVARHAADEVATDIGHLRPGLISIGEVEAAIRGAGKTAISDPEKIERHGEKPMLEAAQGLSGTTTE
jgi:hypothetical protein